MTTWQPESVMVGGVGSMGAAVAVGLASAGGFALSNAMQHRAAGTVPATVHRALAVLVHLARQRSWLVATGISFCALVLHAVALQLGSIALVQPLMLAGVVLAVPVRAGLERKRPRWCEVRAVGVTVLGLAVFIVSADPGASTAAPALLAAAGFVLGCFVVGLGALHASRGFRLGDDRLRAALLGAGAGVLFGATAGLLKYAGSALTAPDRRWAVVVVLGMLAVAGLLGTAMNQRAYQIAPIAFSMPLVNVVDIMVAVLFGAVVFGEVPGHTVSHVVVQVAALGCVTTGLALIAALRVRPGTLSPVGRLEGQLR